MKSEGNSLEHSIILTVFFALYANVDSFTYKESEIPYEQRPELDRWILSLLNSLIRDVTESYDNYEPTRAGRAISEFITENLFELVCQIKPEAFSGEESMIQIKSPDTRLCIPVLEKVAMLAAPIAPFYADRLFIDLNKVADCEDAKFRPYCTIPNPRCESD